MGSPRLLIMLLWLFIGAQVICNWFENDDMYAGTNIAATENVTNYYISSSTDTSGVVTSFVDFGREVAAFCGKLFLFDYSLFYNVDSTTGAKTANDISILRYLLIAIGIVMWIDLALTGRRMLLGG